MPRPTFIEKIKDSFQEVQDNFFTLLESKFNTPRPCPLCKQTATIWKKTPISTSAQELCLLVRLYKGEPIHLSSFTLSKSDRGNGNFSQLKNWGLIAPEPKDPKDSKKRTSGMWHPTEKGIKFVLGEVTLSKFVITYNNEVLEYDGDHVSIHDVVGEDFDFDFQELMSRKSPLLEGVRV